MKPVYILSPYILSSTFVLFSHLRQHNTFLSSLNIIRPNFVSKPHLHMRAILNTHLMPLDFIVPIIWDIIPHCPPLTSNSQNASFKGHCLLLVLKPGRSWPSIFFFPRAIYSSTRKLGIPGFCKTTRNYISGDWVSIAVVFVKNQHDVTPHYAVLSVL
jgi:hypothetical protein